MTLIVNLKHLMTRKGAEWGRRLYYKDISAETGITVSTLSRIAVDPKYNISKAHIEKLCKFFDVKPGELLSLVDDPSEE